MESIFWSEISHLCPEILETTSQITNIFFLRNMLGMESQTYTLKTKSNTLFGT